MELRSSRPEVFLKKCVLKIGGKFTEYPCRSVISIIPVIPVGPSGSHFIKLLLTAYLIITFDIEKL